MGHERIASELLDRRDEVNDGKTTYAEIGEEIRRRSFVPPPSVEDTLAIMRKYEPDFAQEPIPEAEQGRRKALSEKARDAVIDYAVRRSASGIPQKKYGLPNESRHFMHYFDYSGTEEANAHNDALAKLWQTGTEEEKANFIYNYIMTKTKPQIEKVLTMSTEELVNNYDKSAEHIYLTTEMGRVIDSLPFTEEQKKNLQPLIKLQSFGVSALEQIDIVSQPLYSQLPLENFLKGKGESGLQFYSEIESTAAGQAEKAQSEEKVRSYGPLLNLAHSVKGSTAYYQVGLTARYDYAVASQGGDLRNVFNTGGKRLSEEQRGEAVLRGEPLFAVIPGKGMVPTFAHLNGDPPKIAADPEQTQKEMGSYFAARTRAMLGQVKEASPWWLMTGSAEFSNMEKAMKRFAALAEKGAYPPMGAAAQELLEAAEQMKSTSREYLNKKGERMQERDGTVAVDPKTGCLIGKNERETNRLQAAYEMEKIAEQMTFIVSCGAQPQEKAKKAEEDLAAIEKKAQEALERKERMERERKEKEKADLVSEEKRCTVKKEELLKEKERFPKLAPEYEGDPLPNLAQSCATGIDMLASYAAPNKQITGSSRENDTLVQFGRMTTLRLIQAEREMWKKNNPGQPLQGPGELEKKLLVNQQITIHTEKRLPEGGEKVNPFREVVGEITPARIQKFLQTGEDKTLGQKYLDRVSAIVKEKTGGEKTAVKEEIKITAEEKGGKTTAVKSNP